MLSENKSPRKQRFVYILLAIFLGFVSGHHFYSGHVKKAVFEIMISILPFFFIFYYAFQKNLKAVIIAAVTALLIHIILSITHILDIARNKTDVYGRPFEE